MTISQLIERARRAQERFDRRVNVQLRIRGI